MATWVVARTTALSARDDVDLRVVRCNAGCVASGTSAWADAASLRVGAWRAPAVACPLAEGVGGLGASASLPFSGNSGVVNVDGPASGGAVSAATSPGGERSAWPFTSDDRLLSNLLMSTCGERGNEGLAPVRAVSNSNAESAVAAALPW